MDRRVQRFNFGVPWEDSHGYSQGLRVGSLVHIAGQTPHDLSGGLVGGGDASAQTRAVLENLERVLAALGATRNQVVENTVLVVDLHVNFEAVSLAHRAFFGDHRPTSTVLGVDALVFPGQVVEISARANLELRK